MLLRWIEFESLVYGFEGRARLSCYFVAVEIVDIFIFLGEGLGQVEDSINTFFGFSISEFLADSVEEIVEVHLSALFLEIADHLIDGWALFLEAQRVHC